MEVQSTHANFVGNAAYEEALPEDETEVSQVAQFEFIPWILTQCATCLLYTSGQGRTEGCSPGRNGVRKSYGPAALSS